MFDPQEQALRIIAKQLLALDDLVREARESTNTNLAYEQLERWKTLTVDLLTKDISQTEARALENKRMGSFIMG